MDAIFPPPIGIIGVEIDAHIYEVFGGGDQEKCTVQEVCINRWRIGKDWKATKAGKEVMRTDWVSSKPGSSCLCVRKWEEEEIVSMMGDTYTPFDVLAEPDRGPVCHFNEV